MPKNKKSGRASSRTKPTSKIGEIMDRTTLKTIVSHLNEAGSKIVIKASDSDDAIQKKVNDALQALPSVEVIKTIESIDPVKLSTVLKGDCLGVFVDFSDVSCVRCADAARCVSTFIANMKTGFSYLNSTMSSDSEKSEVITKYDPKRLVFIRDVPNPNPKGDDYYDTIQRILNEQPGSLAELREIVSRDFDLDDDDDFMRFVNALRHPKEGVIKLDVDLSKSDRLALKNAGYDI